MSAVPLPSDFAFLAAATLDREAARERADLSKRWTNLIVRWPALDSPAPLFVGPAKPADFIGEAVPPEAMRQYRQLFTDLHALGQRTGVIHDGAETALPPAERIRQAIRHTRLSWRIGPRPQVADCAADVDGLCELWRDLLGRPPRLPSPTNMGEALDLLDQLEEELDRKGPAARSNQSIEQHMERIVQAVGDDSTARILAIASRNDWSGERKMQEILRLDNRFAGKDSEDWATLLGVTSAAVRAYPTWKGLRQQQKADD
jgi:hypothetical protein